jgi:hypothetical protein
MSNNFFLEMFKANLKGGFRAIEEFAVAEMFAFISDKKVRREAN